VIFGNITCEPENAVLLSPKDDPMIIPGDLFCSMVPSAFDVQG